MSATMPSRRSPLLALFGLGLLLALTLALLLPAPAAAMSPSDPDYAAHMENNKWSNAHRASALQEKHLAQVKQKMKQMQAEDKAKFKEDNSGLDFLSVKKVKDANSKGLPQKPTQGQRMELEAPLQTQTQISQRRIVTVAGKKDPRIVSQRMMGMLAVAERARAQQQGALSPMGAKEKEEESQLAKPLSLLSTRHKLAHRSISPAIVPPTRWPTCRRLRSPLPAGHMGPAPLMQSVGVVRTAIRGGMDIDVTQSAPNKPFFRWELNAGNYPGRVEAVRFDVVRNDGQSDPGHEASIICAVLWNPECAGNAWWQHGGDHSFTPMMYHRGHIWAAFLGGSNDDPMNFIPMHYMSNSNGGVWQRAERMAGALKDAFENYVDPDGVGILTNWFNACQVRVAIRFTHWMAGSDFVPSRGTYRISITDACYGLPWTGPNLPKNVWTTGATFQSNLVKAFFQHQKNDGAGNRYVEVTWYNQQDIAMQAEPSQGIANPPPHAAGRYRIVRELYSNGQPPQRN